MTNLQPYKEGYRYSSGTEGPIIEISVDYSLGGANYFHGTQDPRGVYVHITPVTLEKHDGYTSRTFVIGGSSAGVKFCAMELKRKSAKSIRQIAEAIDQYVPQIAQQYQNDRQAAINWMHSVLAPFRIGIAA